MPEICRLIGYFLAFQHFSLMDFILFLIYTFGKETLLQHRFLHKILLQLRIINKFHQIRPMKYSKWNCSAQKKKNWWFYLMHWTLSCSRFLRYPHKIKTAAEKCLLISYLFPMIYLMCNANVSNITVKISGLTVYSFMNSALFYGFLISFLMINCSMRSESVSLLISYAQYILIFVKPNISPESKSLTSNHRNTASSNAI